MGLAPAKPATRVCAYCDTVLRESNPEPWCSLHRPKLPMRYSPYYDSDREWLDGKKLAAWLDSIIEDTAVYDNAGVEKSIRRSIDRWRTGAGVSVYSADHVLIALGHHPSEIPDDIWLDGPPPRKSQFRTRTYSEQERKRIARKALHQPLAAVAREYEVAERTLRLWREKFYGKEWAEMKKEKQKIKAERRNGR